MPPWTHSLLDGTILRKHAFRWADEFSAAVLAGMEPPAVRKIQDTAEYAEGYFRWDLKAFWS